MSNNSDQIIVKHKDSIFEYLRRFIFGDDIFISYSHVDSTYVLSLANELTKRNYLAFWTNGEPPRTRITRRIE